MPAKVYTRKRKEEINIQLLENALSMYSKYGIRNVTLMDVVKSVGISKPFFYTFYGSVQEFVVCVLDYQWTKFPVFFDEVDLQTHLSWEEKVYKVLKKVVYYNESGFLVMTQEEEVWVRKYINDEQYNKFMDNQMKAFENILIRWGIPLGNSSPKIFANMFLMMIIAHSSAKSSLPFLYLDELDETAEAQIRSLIAYLKLLRNQL